MNNIHVCVSIARKHPESLAFEAASDLDNSQEGTSNNVNVMEEDRAETVRLADEIEIIQLNPKDGA